MRVGIFICNQIPDDWYLLAAIGELNWMVDKPLAFDDQEGNIFYSVEYNADMLGREELLEILNHHGFHGVEFE